jgi:hypothetical protein
MTKLEAEQTARELADRYQADSFSMPESALTASRRDDP